MDDDGQPTQKILETRRRAEFITPIPKPKKRRKADATQDEIVFDEGKGLSTKEQQYNPNTLLIDSEQLEAGDALDDNFRSMAADEIERFRREIVERTGDARAGDNITDQELLREIMNTVGKPGQTDADSLVPD